MDLFHVSVYPWVCVVLVVNVKITCLGGEMLTSGQENRRDGDEKKPYLVIDMIANASFSFHLLLTATLR